MTVQSLEETLRLFDEYQRGGYAPPDLILDADNGKAMFEFVIAKWGIVSITYLREAERLLGAKLKRRPQPKEPTQVEIAARLEAKMRKDFADSIADQSLEGVQKRNQQKAEVDNKAAEAKELKQLNSQIEFEVSGYTVGHASGVTDFTRTESGRATLRSVRDQHDRRTIAGTKLALAAVRVAKSKL